MNIKLILKRIVTNKLFLSLLAIAIIVSAGIITYTKITTINETERIALNDFASRILPYLDEVDYDGDKSSRADDNYIIFAMKYNFGENNKTEMTVDEIDTLVKDKFNYNIDKEELNHNIATPRLMEEYVHYDDQNATFVLDRQYIDKQLIAITPINVYIEQDARKSKGQFIVKYAKYQFETPYKILDCASQNNLAIPEFDNYISGKASDASIKRAMNQTCVDSGATRQKEITVTYATKDNHLYIKEIK